MEEKIVLILQFGLELAYLLIGFTALFGGKLIRKWLLVLCYAGFGFGVCLNDIHSNQLLMDRLVVVGALLANVLCFFVISTDNPKKIRWIIVRLIILTYLDELMTMIVKSVVELCGIRISEEWLYLFGYAVNTFVMILIAVIYSRYKTTFFNLKITPFFSKSMIPLLFFLVFEIFCLIVSINVLIEKYSDLRHLVVGKGLSFMAMISIGIFVVMVLYVKKSNETMEQMLVMEKQMQEFQKNYYEMLLEKEAETKKYRHDLNGHLVCLNGLVNDNDLEGVKEYIKEMDTYLGKIKNLSYHTGIEIFDILLNHYAVRLQQDTEVKIKCEDYCTIDVSDMEQCMIFSNIIKNAAEAVRGVEVPPYYLEINVTKGRKYVQISIVNPMNEEKLCLDKAGKLQTSKEDKANHGMGLQNVEKAVERNNGRIHYDIKEKEFCCEVILPICNEN